MEYMGFLGGSDCKESACNAGDPGFDPWVGKIPRRDGYPLFLLLENPMDRGAWQEESMGSQWVTQDWATNTFTFHVECGPRVLIHWSVCNTVLQIFLGCMANCGHLWMMELYVYNLLSFKRIILFADLF